MSWYLTNGPEGDVVISTRVRFARNIAGINFVNKCEKEDLENVLNTAKDKLTTKAKQILDLFAPLAARLGLSTYKTELENLNSRGIYGTTSFWCDYYNLDEDVYWKNHIGECNGAL